MGEFSKKAINDCHGIAFRLMCQMILPPEPRLETGRVSINLNWEAILLARTRELSIIKWFETTRRRRFLCPSTSSITR